MLRTLDKDNERSQGWTGHFIAATSLKYYERLGSPDNKAEVCALGRHRFQIIISSLPGLSSWAAQTSLMKALVMSLLPCPWQVSHFPMPFIGHIHQSCLQFFHWFVFCAMKTSTPSLCYVYCTCSSMCPYHPAFSGSLLCPGVLQL